MTISSPPSQPSQKDGFNPDYFPLLAELEPKNFWFLSRNRLIVWAIQTFLKNRTKKQFLEIGCGTGFVLQAIDKHFPEMELSGSELFAEGLEFARKRVPTASLVAIDAKKIQFAKTFDAIGAFDVLEHIDEDELVLRELNKALKDDGLLFITVPQHAWLWSPSDEIAHHCRRYEAPEMHHKLTASGFTTLMSTSFVSLLLPAMLVSRMFQRSNENYSVLSELQINQVVSKIFEFILAMELAFIKAGFRWKVGGSLFVVARKTSK